MAVCTDGPQLGHDMQFWSDNVTDGRKPEVLGACEVTVPQGPSIFTFQPDEQLQFYLDHHYERPSIVHASHSTVVSLESGAQAREDEKSETAQLKATNTHTHKKELVRALTKSSKGGKIDRKHSQHQLAAVARHERTVEWQDAGGGGQSQFEKSETAHRSRSLQDPNDHEEECTHRLPLRRLKKRDLTDKTRDLDNMSDWELEVMIVAAEKKLARLENRERNLAKEEERRNARAAERQEKTAALAKRQEKTAYFAKTHALNALLGTRDLDSIQASMPISLSKAFRVALPVIQR